MKMTMRGVVHGKRIELTNEPGLPEGQVVEVTIETTPAPAAPPPWWLEHLVIDSDIAPGQWVIKGTDLLAEKLVEELEAGLSEQQLRRAHPELTARDAAAVSEYAKVARGVRRSAGGWADDPEGLDKYLEWNRQQRKIGRPELDP